MNYLYFFKKIILFLLIFPFSVKASISSLLTNQTSLCEERESLWQNPQVIPPDQWFLSTNKVNLKKLIGMAKNILNQRHLGSNTCAEDILSFIVKEANDRIKREALATILNLPSTQNEILINYGFLLIEGSASFLNPEMPDFLLSFFRETQSIIPWNNMDKGVYLMVTDDLSLARSSTLNGRTRVINYPHKMVIKIYQRQAIRDPIDDSRFVGVDQNLLVMIHELFHGIFHSQDFQKTFPLLFSESEGRPAEFFKSCIKPFTAEAKNEKDIADLEQSYVMAASYYSQVQMNYPKNLENDLLNSMFEVGDNPVYFNLNGQPISRVLGRRAWIFARLYGYSSSAEDWATSAEAYFYNSRMWLQTAKERRDLFHFAGHGAYERFQYFARAFSYTEKDDKSDDKKETLIFSIVNNRVQSERVLFSDLN